MTLLKIAILGERRETDMTWPFENDTGAIVKNAVLLLGLFLLVLFGMEIVLSVWMVRRQKKQSLVEQMRAQG